VQDEAFEMRFCSQATPLFPLWLRVSYDYGVMVDVAVDDVAAFHESEFDDDFPCLAVVLLLAPYLQFCTLAQFFSLGQHHHH